MSHREAPSAIARLEAAAKQWERDVVIPHCAVCTRPCCALTDVVLDLSPAEAETLYRITPASKHLPTTVQAHGGRYYAHGAPCPAYAVGTKRCAIYDTGRKPKGCGDFPVYADDDTVTADRRCEAVAANLSSLEDALFEALEKGETLEVLQAAPGDDEDDVFVSFRAAAPPGKAAPKQAPTRQGPPSAPRRKSQPQGKPEPKPRSPAPPRESATPPPPWRAPRPGQPPADGPHRGPGPSPRRGR